MRVEANAVIDRHLKCLPADLNPTHASRDPEPAATSTLVPAQTRCRSTLGSGQNGGFYRWLSSTSGCLGEILMGFRWAVGSTA